MSSLTINENELNNVETISTGSEASTIDNNGEFFEFSQKKM